MEQLTKEDLLTITRGATFLGCGGGGTPDAARYMINNDWSGDIAMVDVDHAEGVTVACSFIGSQTAGVSVSTIDAMHRAVFDLNQRMGKNVANLVPIDLGVQSAVVPTCLTAGHLNLKVVDADGAGRGVPAIMLTKLATPELRIAEDPALPAIGVVSNGRESATIGCENAMQFQQQASALTERWGTVAAIALWPMRLAELIHPKDLPVVPGTLSLAKVVGEALDASTTKDPIARLRKELSETETAWPRAYGYELFTGHVARIVRTSPDYKIIELLNRETREQAWVYAAGENIFARSSSRLLGMAPDLLCWFKFHKDGHEPISNTQIANGDRVALFGLAAEPSLRANENAMLGFRAFRNWALAGAPYPLAPDEIPYNPDPSYREGEAPFDDYVSIEELQLGTWAAAG